MAVAGEIGIDVRAFVIGQTELILAVAAHHVDLIVRVVLPRAVENDDVPTAAVVLCGSVECR